MPLRRRNYIVMVKLATPERLPPGGRKFYAK